MGGCCAGGSGGDGGIRPNSGPVNGHEYTVTINSLMYMGVYHSGPPQTFTFNAAVKPPSLNFPTSITIDGVLFNCTVIDVSGGFVIEIQLS